MQVSSPLYSCDVDDSCQWEARLLSAGFHIRAHHRCRVTEEGFHLYGEVNTLT
jgi:hypothetical protein